MTLASLATTNQYSRHGQNYSDTAEDRYHSDHPDRHLEYGLPSPYLPEFWGDLQGQNLSQLLVSHLFHAGY